MLGATSAAWPLGVRAQARLPAIGFLGSTSASEYEIRLQAFVKGLEDGGYVDGRNVTIDYRWAEGRSERPPDLAAALVRAGVAVIAAAGGTPSALAAKAATSTIPIVFAIASDPVQAGLVASLNRPGGNVTGVANQNAEVGPKRLEMLHELLPNAVDIAVLVNPTNPTLGKQFLHEVEPAVRALSMRIHLLEASTEQDLDTVFASLAKMRVDALVIGPDIFFNSQTEQLATRTLRSKLPAIYQYYRFAAAGGLVSYGASEPEYYRLVGDQVAKILNGAKPGELPVQQSTKIELIVNLKTAKTLGIVVPGSLLARADEVIE